MARVLIDADAAAQTLKTLGRRHGTHLRPDESFDLQGRLEGDTIFVTLTLASEDRTLVYVMEAAVTTQDTRIRSTAEGVDLCLDFLDWYLGVYFEDQRETLLPLDWQPHQFGDLEVLARGDVHNEVLDGLADAWLRGERPEVPDFAKR